MHSRSHRVAASEQSRTRRRAHWAGYSEVTEIYTIRGHLVEIWGLNARAITTQVAKPEVVGKNQNYVGWLGSRSDYRWAANSEQSRSGLDESATIHHPPRADQA